MSADDLSKYREMFVQEAREHVQNMNSALLALEKDHTNKEHLDSAFRAAMAAPDDAASHIGRTRRSCQHGRAGADATVAS